jgi:hypothetical protein
MVLALGYAAVASLSVLMVICAGAIVWIVARTDAPAAARIASVTGTVSTFGAIAWGLLRHAEQRLASIATERPSKGAETALPLQRQTSFLGRFSLRLPDRRR